MLTSANYWYAVANPVPYSSHRLLTQLHNIHQNCPAGFLFPARRFRAAAFTPGGREPLLVRVGRRGTSGSPPASTITRAGDMEAPGHILRRSVTGFPRVSLERTPLHSSRLLPQCESQPGARAFAACVRRFDCLRVRPTTGAIPTESWLHAKKHRRVGTSTPNFGSERTMEADYRRQTPSPTLGRTGAHLPSSLPGILTVRHDSNAPRSENSPTSRTPE